MRGVPGRQTPELHRLRPLHGLPSGQVVPSSSGVCTHPIGESRHPGCRDCRPGSPAWIARTVPPMHRSFTVHASLSAQCRVRQRSSPSTACACIRCPSRSRPPCTDCRRRTAAPSPARRCPTGNSRGRYRDRGLPARLPVGHRREGTPGRSAAAVGRARIAVVARQRIAHARMRDAALVDGAGRGVGAVRVGIAAPRDGLHRAPGDRVAPVDRAVVAIVAARRRARRTAPP